MGDENIEISAETEREVPCCRGQQGVSRTPIKDTILFSDVKWVGKSNSEVRLRTASLGEKLEPDY